MKNKVQIHPFTIPLFILIYFTPYKSHFFILYIFIMFHELSHMLMCLILKENVQSLKLLPWGCMLSLFGIPKRKSSVLIFLAGPVFNLLMYFSGIFPKENLSLALFNLMPVAPLDGGVIINLIAPAAAFYISLLFIVFLYIICFYTNLPPFMPIVLTILLFLGEKNRIDKNISDKVIGYFSSGK